MKGYRNTQEEFWRRVDRRGDDECWPWKDRVNDYGYGKFSYQNHEWKAHRLAWFFHHGRIPRALFVCHHCDNPPCCNPNHLFLGTDADNSADKVAKGRSSRWPLYRPERIARGDTHCCAKLTTEQVRELRQRRSAGITLAVLSQEYGIDESNISKIARGIYWKHVQ